MALSSFAWPAFWLSLSLLLSFLILRQREKLPRHVLAALLVAVVAIGLLGADIEVLRKLPSLSPLAEQLKVTVQIWVNIWRLDDHRLSR
ncbi:hypothetical protein GGTG_11712 [Gaeumannomyces tritici R3-111a-1]|uniref:Uncharacterized protein n=1 Tax=Gaeumannomyces tritici (strain R3-111a-1) TaxID=644352 RepID=J3PDY9_GAET3|nr:hypothetical protein GGTG_11712 [Gaeumannomyces tritici R3-111a-1]EJT70689.1 hypothetical protein GGTG_11712 [Gaeumannomyces tritici R3-111a-1]